MTTARPFILTALQLSLKYVGQAEGLCSSCIIKLTASCPSFSSLFIVIMGKGIAPLVQIDAHDMYALLSCLCVCMCVCVCSWLGA